MEIPLSDIFRNFSSISCRHCRCQPASAVCAAVFPLFIFFFGFVARSFGKWRRRVFVFVSFLAGKKVGALFFGEDGRQRRMARRRAVQRKLCDKEKLQEKTLQVWTICGWIRIYKALYL
jgi:hypothetical protein